MLHIHCPQQWFALSGTAMEEALHEMQVFREFAKLDDGAARLPWQLGPCGARPFVLWKGSVGWEPAAPERLLPVDLDRRAHAAWHQAVARCGGGGSDDGQLNKVQRSSDG